MFTRKNMVNRGTGKGILPFITIAVTFFLNSSSASAVTIAKCSFESSGDTWTFSPDPVRFDVSGDKWTELTSSFHTFDIGSPPTDGTQYWAMQDLDSPSGRSTWLYLNFDYVDVSGYTNVKVMFDYEVDDYDNGDDLQYEIVHDDTTQSAVNVVNGSVNLDQQGTVTSSVPDSVNSVKIILGADQNGGGDYAMFDNVIITGDIASTPCSPDAVTLVQQAAYYTKFTDGGDIFDNGTTELGMWAHGGNKQVVAWRNFRTDGSGGGDLRALEPGDRFRISVHGYSPYGILGASINDGASTGSWANRHSNTRGYIQCGNSYGDLYATYGSGSTASWSGIRPWNTTVTLSFDVLSSSEFTANIEGQTPKYDLLMMNTPGDSDRVDGFSLYYNDDWNGSSEQNAYWKQTTLVTNLGYVQVGADNGTRNIIGKITDGTDPTCTSVVSTNIVRKTGTGTVTLQNTANTYSGVTRVEAGTLAVFTDGNLGAAPTSARESIDIWSTATLRATNTFTLDADRKIQLGNTDGPAISVDSGKTLTYGGVMGGDAAWSKEGAGVLALTGTSSTNKGKVSVEAGTLRISGDGSLGAMPASAAEKINIWSTGTFEADGTFSMDANRRIELGTVNGPKLSVTSGNTLTYGGRISGSANWTKESAGTLKLTGASTASGDLTLNGGTVIQNGTNTSMNIIGQSSTFAYGAGSLDALTINGQASAGSASNTVGRLSATGLNLENNGILQVNISAMTGTAGTDWDVITVGGGSGTYTVNATDGNDFIITLKGSPTFSSSTPYTNIIVDAGTASGFVANKFTINTNEFTPDLEGGSFSVDADGGNLRLIFTPSLIVTITEQGFEGSTNDYWNYTFSAGDQYVYVTDITNASGVYSLALDGSVASNIDPYIEFDNIDISDYASVNFSIDFAVSGADASDDLHLDVSYDDGATWTGSGSTTLVSGASNKLLGFGGTDADTVTANPWIASISGGSQVKIRIRFDERSDGTNTYDEYYIDNVKLTGVGSVKNVSFEALTYYADETNSTFTVPVNISSAADATVRVSLAGTALAGGGNDYTVNSTNIIFKAGGSTTSNLVFTLNDDAVAEGLEEIQLRLVEGRGAVPESLSFASVLVRDDDSFTIMSANLTAGTNLTAGALTLDDTAKRIIQRLRPDIVAMQEWVITNATYRQFVDEVLGSEYEFYLEPESDGFPIPNGVISRWPIVASNEWADSYVGSRDYVHAEIDLPGGKNLNVVSVHFKAGPAEETARANEAQELTNYIANAGFSATDYLVIAGDLNLTSRLESTYLIITQIVTDAHISADQDGDLNTNLGRTAPYDHILPDEALDAEHVAPIVGGYTYTNGMVFDSEQFGDHLLPVLVDDSYTINRTHMAIVKVFNLSTDAVPATVTTTIASATNLTTATTGGNVTDAGGGTVTNRGVVWGTSSTPTVPGPQTTNGTGTGAYASIMTNLVEGETYYYRAFAQNEAGTSYGTEYTLTTPCFGAPSGLYASATNDVNFTATWDAIAGVDGYALDVSTNAAFGGGGSNTLYVQNFNDAGLDEKGISGDSGSGVTTNMSGVTSFTVDAPSSAFTSDSSRNSFEVGSSQFEADDVDGTGTWKSQSVDVNGIASVDVSLLFHVRGSGDNAAGDFGFEWGYGLDGGSVVVVNDIGDQGGEEDQGTLDGTTLSSNGVDVSSATGIVIRVDMGANGSGDGFAFDDVQVITGTGGGTPDFMPGYSNRAVAATSQSVTGLTTGVTYYYRVRATNDYCISGNSSTETVATIFISPAIDVVGNNNSITNGDNSPVVTDLTDFGAVGLVGSNLVHTFTITNDGSSSLTFENVAVGGTHPADFTVSSQPSSPVAVGAGADFTVTFNPAAVGTRTATLYITNNVAADNPYIFDVQGTGVAAGITLRPTNINLTTMIGSAPGNETFGVTNVGRGQLSYAISTNVNWLSVSPVSATLSETESQLETITFSVAGLYAGVSNATITITDANATNSPQSVLVSLTLTNIPDPSTASATPDGYELIDLAWTKATDHDVMIVHKAGSAPTDPDQGVSYALGASVGGGRVIYKGSGAALEHIVSTGTDHYYEFYSINNNHYSPGVAFMTNTLEYALGEVVDAFAYTNGVDFGSGSAEDGGQGFTNAWQVGAETWTVEGASMDVNTNYPDEVANSAKLTNPGNGQLGYMTRGLAPYTSGTFYASAIVRFQYNGGDKYTGIELTSNGTAKAFFGEVRDQDKHPGIAASATASSWANDVTYDMYDYASDTGNVYMIVGRYNFSTRVFDMKVFYKTAVIPALEPATWNASSTLTAGTMNWIDGIRLVGGSSDAGGTLGDAFFDEVRVATSWNELIGIFPEPEIEVVGTNYVGIADGTTSTSTGDGTDFGSTAVAGGQVDHTLFITNSGLGVLNVSGVTTSGTHAADFIILGYPESVYPGTASNLVIRFDPSAAGARTATITVENDDTDEASYDFAVKGTGQVPPTVTTVVANPTNSTTATSGGNVTDEGYSAVVDRGVVWSTSANPTIPGTQSSDGTGSGAFVSTLTGLSPGETYYYRAFATNAAGVSYGTEYSLTAECFGGVVTGLYVSATNDTYFTAVWSNVFGASGYQIDVSTSTNFIINSTGNYGVEVFTNVDGGTVSSYLTRNWTNNGVEWTAYEARIDQTIDTSEALTLQDAAGAYLISEPISGGIDELFVTHQQKFSGSGGTFDIFVNSVRVATNVTISTVVQTTVVQNIDMSGSFTIMITNSADVRLALDNVTWTNAAGPVGSFVSGYESRAVDGTTATVTGLTEGTEYFIRVRATNENGCVTSDSATSSVTTITTYPGIGRSPTNIIHSITMGDAIAAGNFGVTNVGTGTLDYDITTNVNWLSVSPVIGSVMAGAGQQHTITYSSSGLGLGTSNATITITDATATNSPLTVEVSVTITAIVDVATVTLTNDGNELVRLGWTKAPDYNVLIVHNQTNAPSAPTAGTSYSVGSTVGSDGSRVIYSGAGSSLEHVVEPGSINHYAFYSINNDYYSSGYATNTTMDTYDSGVVVETFSYTNATTLAFGTGGQGFSGAWTGDTATFTNDLYSITSQDNYPSNRGNKVRTTPADSKTNLILRTLDSSYGDGELFVSFVMNYQYQGSGKFSGLSLMDGNNEELFVGEVSTADEQLGLDGTSDGDSLTHGNDYVVILRYSWASGTASAVRYLVGTDTVPSTIPGTWDVTLSKASNVVGTIDGIRLATGAGSAGGTPGDTLFDEIRVASSWEELLGVTPSPVIYDWFANSSGSVSGNNGGTGWSNTWTFGGSAFIDFTSTSLPKEKSSYHEPEGNKIVMYGDVDDRDMTLSRNFLYPFTTGVVYFSWMQNYEFQGVNKYAGLSLMDGATEKAFVGKVSDGTYGQLFGIDSSSDDHNSDAGMGNSSNFVIVGKYDFSTRELSASHYEVTTNAIAEEPQGYWHVTSTQSVGHITRLSGIRFGIGADSGTQIGDVYIDEIRVGTNFYEVARRDGESQSKEMINGPIPTLLYVGTNYLTSNEPQGTIVDITVTDADLANSNEPLDIAVLWQNDHGVFMTNVNASLMNIGSRAGRVSPNYDPVVLSGTDFQSVGFDSVFTNFVGYNGYGSVTTYVHSAFNITNSAISNTYFITMSAENNNQGGLFTSPNGGDDIPYYRALTVNTALQFYVDDDDPLAPAFFEYTIDGNGGFGDTNLIAGNIAIIGVNGNPETGDETFSFVVLRPFPVGTIVDFVDCGWDPATTNWHRLTEFHTNRWVSPGNIAVGSVIELDLQDINNDGDQVVVYQYLGGTSATNDPDNVQFLYAVNLDKDGDGWDVPPVIDDNVHSGIYRGLTNGETAVSVPLGGKVANAFYTGTVVGTSSDLLLSISDPDNWFVDQSGTSTNLSITNYTFTITGSGTIDWTLATISDHQMLSGGYVITNIAQDEYSGLVATNTSFANAPYFMLYGTNDTPVASNAFPVTFANGANGVETMVMTGPAGNYADVTIGTVSSLVYVADMDSDRINDFLDQRFSMPVFVYDDDDDAPVSGSGLVTIMHDGVPLNPTNGIELLAGWNFNDSDTEVDYGSGTFSSNTSGFGSFGGSTVNLVTNDVAGSDISVSGTDNIGRYIAFDVDMTGHSNLVMTLAAQRSASGYDSNNISYTVNGSTATVFQTGWSPASSYALATFDFSTESAMNNATSVNIFITFGTNSATGGGNNRFDNIQLNADVARYYEITDGFLTNVSAASPLQFSFNAYDAYSGLSRGTTDNGSNMTITVDGLYTNNVSDFSAAMSSAGTTNSGATSTWVFASTIDYDRRGALFADGQSNRLITASMADADNDRYFDNLWQSNAFFGKMRIIDDDPNPPSPIDISYGSGTVNNRPFYVATNGFVAGSSDLIRGNYSRRSGVGSTSVFAVTDADLAQSDTISMEFVFGVVDQEAEIGRGTVGDTNSVMSISIGSAVIDNFANYNSGASSGSSGPGVTQSNIWKFADGFFDDTVINNLMAVESNRVAVTVPDTDNDRTNDYATIYSETVGWLEVYDDDISGPTMSRVQVMEDPGAGTVLATSFESTQGWPVSTAGYISSTNWTVTDSFGTWVGSGAQYTTLQNKPTGTKRIGLLVNTNAPNEQYIQLPPIDNPGSLTFSAARFSGDNATLRVERANSLGSWIGIGGSARTITNLQDNAFLNYSININYSGNDVTLRVVRVGSTGPQVSLDDIAVSSQPTWISTNQLSVVWAEGIEDYSAINYYNLVTPAITSTVPATTNDGIQLASTITSAVQSILGQQGVITGFVFSVDDDSDRASDEAMGNIVSVIVKIDTNPPPAVANFAASNDLFDATAKINLTWTPKGTEGEAAGRRESDGAALSPFVSYRIYYTENTMVDPTYSDDYYDATNSPYTDLGTHSTTALSIDGLIAGFTYHLAMAGIDEAGNLGPMSDVAVVTLETFGISTAFANEDHHTVIQWEGNEENYYDIIYADDDEYSSRLDSLWKLASTIQGTQFVDEGGADAGSNTNRVSPNQITESTMRFYRISPVNAWIPAGERAGAASEEVVVAHLISLAQSNNFIGISMVPFTSTTNMATFFGTSRLESAGSQLDATRINLYPASQTGNPSDTTLWLSPTGWVTQANGLADTNEIPFPYEGFNIYVPEKTNFLMVGRVPYTNAPSISIVATQAYNVLSMNLPRPTKVNELGIRSNLTWGMSLLQADEIRIMTKGTAPWGRPRARIFVDTDGVYRFSNYGNAEYFEIMPDEAIILYTRGTTNQFEINWAGTNFYTKPQIAIDAVITAAPSVKAFSTLIVDTTNAILRGSVNPNGLQSDFWFQYGTTTNYGTTLGALTLPATNVAVTVSSNIYNLIPGAKYYFQLVASNAVGLSRFGTGSFSISGGPTDMAYIPAHSFIMGATTNLGDESSADELPQHAVSVSAFYMDKYEVTLDQYETIYGWAVGNGYGFSNDGTGSKTNGVNDHPVINIDWYDAVKWCNARSEMEGLTPVYYTSTVFTNANIYKTGSVDVTNNWVNWTGEGYRLPTEAEWEAAARGGVSDYRFPWTDYTNKIGHAKANFYNNGGEGYQTGTTGYHPSYDNIPTPYTAPIGSFDVNQYGLYDMAGNVKEFCWDWYGSSYYASSPGSDPRGPAGSNRIIRGGSWGAVAALSRMADRDSVTPSSINNNIGFRTVRDAP